MQDKYGYDLHYSTQYKAALNALVFRGANILIAGEKNGEVCREFMLPWLYGRIFMGRTVVLLLLRICLQFPLKLGSILSNSLCYVLLCGS